MPIYGPGVKRLLRRAQVVLATSEPYLRTSPYLRACAQKCMVVPSGIPMDRFEDMQRHATRADELRQEFGAEHVLFVGRLRYYRGVDVLLRALARVEVPAVIVGTGPMQEELSRLHLELGLGARVRFVGAVSDEELLAHLLAASIGVLPSTHPSEALGLALVEYLTAGIPAICTELGTGTTFVSPHQRTGLAVAPGDPEALAGAIRQLMESPESRARFGAAGRERARLLFSEEAMVRGYAAAYEVAIERSVAGRSGRP